MSIHRQKTSLPNEIRLIVVELSMNFFLMPEFIGIRAMFE